MNPLKKGHSEEWQKCRQALREDSPRYNAEAAQKSRQHLTISEQVFVQHFHFANAGVTFLVADALDGVVRKPGVLGNAA